MTNLRIGNGYDIHKLVENRDFIIGGVKIPFDKGFLAHSDGDLLIHAIIDALLGACSYGDIGTLFPDTDSNYKGIDSTVLLKNVLEKLSIAGVSIINIDNTIICQKPKLMPHIQEVRKNLSSIIGIPLDRISVKAKTKEGIDGTGEGRSVEVFSTVLVEI